MPWVEASPIAMAGMPRLVVLVPVAGLLNMPTLRVWYQVGMMNEVPQQGWLLSVSHHSHKH